MNTGAERARSAGNEYIRFTGAELREFWETQGWSDTECSYCSEAIELDQLHLDHAVPISSGGSHTVKNVRPSCAGCNLAKQNKSDTEFLEELAKEGK